MTNDELFVIRYSSFPRSQSPFLIKKSGFYYVTRIYVHNCVIRQFWNLQRVAGWSSVRESKTAIDDNVMIRVERIGINQEWHVPRVGFAGQMDAGSVPSNRELRGDARQQPVTLRISPEHQVICIDILFGDRRVILHPRLAAKLPP